MEEPKLVRDLIPDRIRADGKTPEIRIAEPSERPGFLYAKLGEEMGELLFAQIEQDRAKVLEELGDVEEVGRKIRGTSDLPWQEREGLAAAWEQVSGQAGLIQARFGISVEEVEDRRRQKREERGGFDGWIILVAVN